MANAEAALPSESKRQKGEPDTCAEDNDRHAPADAPAEPVVPPPPTPPVDVESPNSPASDGQDEPMEDDSHVDRSESQDKSPSPGTIPAVSAGEVATEKPIGACHVVGSGSEDNLPVTVDNCEPDQTMEDCHVADSGSEGKLNLPPKSESAECLQLEKQDSPVLSEIVDNCTLEQPVVDCHVGTPELEKKPLHVTQKQPMGSRQVAKSVSANKRKLVTRSEEGDCLWFQKTSRRVTRSNSKINGENGENSPVEYLGNNVDILGLERALKKLNRLGSKKQSQEPVNPGRSSDATEGGDSLEKKSECIMPDPPIKEIEMQESAVAIIYGSNETDTMNQNEGLTDPGHSSDAMDGGDSLERKSGSIVLDPVKQEETHIKETGMQELAVIGTLDSSKLYNEITTEEMQIDRLVLAKPLKRLTRSVAKVAQNDSSNVQGPPLRRFTRSLLKTESALNETQIAVSEEKPAKRFTRSLLVNDNKSEGGPTSLEEGENCDADSVDQSSLTTVEKVGVKRGRNTSLTKLPSNARELLATGLLEGLPVMYIIPYSRKPMLKGVISGCNILCFCSVCKGSRAVSVFNFELHAGSSKKHPSDFIFLENGNTLHDVLKACASAPVDMLERDIHREIDPVPRKNLRTCLRCTGSLPSSNGCKFFLCDTCSEMKQIVVDTQRLENSERSPRVEPAQSSIERPFKSIPLSTKKPSSSGRITKKHHGLHKLVFMNDILPEGTEVAYYIGGERLLDGYIKEGAIFCHHCMTVVSPSQFEAHAGQSSRRKPYNNIYTSNGVSLHELSVSLSIDKKMSAGEATDDLCTICSDGGDLICCHVCPRAFHLECVGLREKPEGDWYCQCCVSMGLHRRDKSAIINENERAAGRVAGVDPIEQIFKRCIRIVSVPETDLGGCAICKLHDFSPSGFDDRTVILCDQCEREYHVGCLRDHNMADLKELPEGEWFCCTNCSTMHTTLKELILGGAQPLTSSDLDTIKSKRESKGLTNDGEINYYDVRWRLIAGKTVKDEEEGNSLLSGAVRIFHESFDPIIDAKTRQDLIPAMVYGRDLEGHQDYSGMYCAVLTAGSRVVSAGLLHVFGTDAAELPLVATSRDLQGQGYFQALFSCIERILVSLKVKHFVLPAAEEAESIWTNKFGFSGISSDQLEKYLNGAHITAFWGTSTLHKLVPLS